MKIINSVSVLVVVSLLLAACKDPSLAEQQLEFEKTKAEIAQRIEKISDPELRAAASDVADTLNWFKRIELEQAEPPTAVAYDEDPFSWLQDYPEPSALVSNYTGGLIALTGDTYRLGVIDIKLPFTYPFDSELLWSSVELADGTTVPVSGEFAITPPDVSLSNGGSRLEVVPSAKGFTDDTSLPHQVKGVLEIGVPEEIAYLTLTAKDRGKSHKLGDYLVTLTEISGHVVSVEVARQDGGPISEDPMQLLTAAKDKTGQFLASSGSSSGPSADFFAQFSEYLLTLLTQIEQGKMTADSVEAAMEQHAEQLKEKFGDLYVKQQFFRGTVETVAVVFAGKTLKQDIPLQLPVYLDKTLDFNAAVDIDDIPVQSVAYAHELAYLTAKDRAIELPSNTVASAIQIQPGERWGDEVYVEFTYPKQLVSNLFVDAFRRYEFDDAQVSFFDADGQPISGEPSYNFTVNRLEYTPSSFSKTPVRMQGKFQVNLMPELEFAHFSAEALPDDIEVKDNQLRIRGSDQEHTYALDAEGRFLRKFYSQRFANTQGPSTRVDYYYGKPSHVLAIKPGELETIEYVFDAPLTVPVEE